MSYFDDYNGQRVYRDDKTFVIDRDGLPYHVIPGDPLYDEASADFETNKELWTVEIEPYEPPEPTIREKILLRMEELDEYASPRTSRGAVLGNKSDLKILKNIESEIEELRELLKNIPEDE